MEKGRSKGPTKQSQRYVCCFERQHKNNIRRQVNHTSQRTDGCRVRRYVCWVLLETARHFKMPIAIQRWLLWNCKEALCLRLKILLNSQKYDAIPEPNRHQCNNLLSLGRTWKDSWKNAQRSSVQGSLAITANANSKRIRIDIHFAQWVTS
jgi:hypothetical protein